jgi:hypothetical protein
LKKAGFYTFGFWDFIEHILLLRQSIAHQASGRLKISFRRPEVFYRNVFEK